MYAERHVISLLTDGSQNALAYSPVVTGRVLGIAYVKTDFADTADITITVEGTGEAILTLTNQTASGKFYPRAQVHGPTGVALTLEGTEPLVEPIVVAKDRIKVAVAEGGAAKTGAIHVIIG